MAKKRKSDATRLDEVDRSICTSFCSAANSLSQLYTQAMNHLRLSFQASEVTRWSAPYSHQQMAQGVRSGDNLVKNSVLSNALSSPVCRSLQHYPLVQGGYNSNNVVSSINGQHNIESNYSHQQNRDVNFPSSNNSMDMHADCPGHYFPC
ncbi:uncharacterized protein LOC111316388 [Durio zibethinus]|uniref:Uncharacterized protein LOC111316388 n=1 Tax=Durio zibethinus TaxID=66656 RepID=A0A6P6BAG3_DURZI|nr:uncharacterized protein LOC111316388 [Durio zibethinus]